MKIAIFVDNSTNIDILLFKKLIIFSLIMLTLNFKYNQTYLLKNLIKGEKYIRLWIIFWEMHNRHMATN